MTVKKCDVCGKVYEKGYSIVYSLDPYEVNKASVQTKFEYATTKDLCEICGTRLKKFFMSRKGKNEKEIEK